jgi:hypothetical protein
MHISNLYRPEAQTILLFREVYALEKIHGTSCHVSFKHDGTKWNVSFFAGGEKHETFVKLFNEEQLLASINSLGIPIDMEVTIFGEGYGGKCQGMSATYGPNLKFIVFDVKVGDCWLSVPDAEDVAKKLGLEFVHYVKVSTDLKSLDAERDAFSVQSVRNGVTTPEDFLNGKGKPREGVVLRPLIEVTLNNGERMIAKHKSDAFKETSTPRPVVDPSQMKVLADANAVANEWVTATRLEHVLDKLPGHCMEKMREIIGAMTEDVFREGKGEIVESEAVKKAIGKKTVEMYKNHLKSQIK